MWAATWKEIAQVTELTKSQGRALAVVIIPELRQVDPAIWQALSGASASDYERDRPNHRIAEYCENAGIPVIDLLPTFAAAGQPRRNYFAVDNHWTARGNVIAAGAIANFVTERGLASATGATTLARRIVPAP
jgi:hypothetical protein